MIRRSRVRRGVVYDDHEKTGGSRRSLLSIMIAQVIRKDHGKPINLSPIDIFPFQ